MKILGVCSETIENLENLLPDSNIKFLTLSEVLDLQEKQKLPDCNICVVDAINLLALSDIKIVDVFVTEPLFYKRKKVNYSLLPKLFEKTKEKEGKSVSMHHKIIPFLLDDYTFLTHLNEYCYNFRDFIFKLDSRLKGEKVKFSVSERYRNQMKEVFSLSPLYLDFLQNTKKKYPKLFTFLKKYLTFFKTKEEE